MAQFQKTPFLKENKAGTQNAQTALFSATIWQKDASTVTEIP